MLSSYPRDQWSLCLKVTGTSVLSVHVDLLCVPCQQVTSCTTLLALQPNTTHATAKHRAELASNCVFCQISNELHEFHNN